MRKIVLKKTWTNCAFAIVTGIFIAIVLFPLSIYLHDIGLSLRYSIFIALCIANAIALPLTNLIVTIEPTKPAFPKGLIVFVNAIGFLVVCGGVAMQEIFLVCLGALLLASLWAWVIHERRKTTKKNRLLEGEET